MTIIIPSYNQQDYLSDAIESALAQQVVSNLDIIVVDDGSTDNSLEIAKRYPVRVISQVNKGLASARNTGIMNAKDDWILFLDADDVLKDDCVFKIDRAIQTNPGADIISGSFKTFGTSSQEIILMPNPTLEDFKSGNRIGYCSAIRKSALLEVGGYDPEMTFGYEDLSLTCQLLVRGKKIVTIPEILWLYRTKEKSMWTKAKEHHQELLEIINRKVPECQLNF